MAGGRLWQFLLHHVVRGPGQTDPCRLQTLSCSGVCLYPLCALRTSPLLKLWPYFTSSSVACT